MCSFRFLSTFVLLFLSCEAYIVNYGPVVEASRGAIWPKPVAQTSTASFYTIRPSVFEFKSIGKTCDILKNAIDRYNAIIRNHLYKFRRHQKAPDSKWKSAVEYQGHLDSLDIELQNKCEDMPQNEMDESYTININDSSAKIKANSIWGILRGMESFSQLLYISPDLRSLLVNNTIISDEPRFTHRGLLVDTSRHFLTLSTLHKVLDGMSYNKLNVFHWHIVDDHSFPYQSKKFPELTKGAYDESMIYSQEDVASIIEYARQRGIRVMAEFDTPGHTASWGASHPELLTKCEGPYTGKLGPINPIDDNVYDFIFELFEEIVDVFPDKHLHLGGDEVGFECWETNEEILLFMLMHNITRFEVLEEHYIQKIIDQVTRLKKKSIVWQEVFTNGVKLPNGTIVHVWMGDQISLMGRITMAGLPVLLSTCWYLDHLATGGDWLKFYRCDPHAFPGTVEMKKLVMGGEACMWGEVVDDANVIQRIFPRASATAEKLWSKMDVTDEHSAMKRLEEHYCRMRIRNIAAQPPNGPGLCLH